ncbi:U-box domain-containing protein 25 [Coffea eugenioides]|uniref:U-box domain-containing protein 25 n=1 Tax=Coffea eugenioides TaxID=49369 RepID=UPI000F613346|nr:U-box domain-containing protein 25 [Coffea eugenioides]
MKSQHPKLKTAPRPLFSCGFFRNCTQTVLSPTTTTPPALPFPATSDQPPPKPTSPPPPPPPPPPPLPPPPSSSHPPHAPTKPDSESSSSSSNTSQSFTQWRFPLTNSPISHHLIHPYQQTQEKPKLSEPTPPRKAPDSLPPPPLSATKLEETFHVAELRFSSGSDEDKLGALHLLEKSLVPNPRAVADGGDAVACPATVMKWVVSCLKERVMAKSASKVLLALCLVEGDRHAAVEAGAVGVVVDAMADLEGAVAERSLAALELLCTVAEGAAELRSHALAVPMMVEVMGRMEGRGKEYAISVLAVIFGGCTDGAVVAPPEEVARAVMLALQGDCSARGRRKAAQLLKILQEENGRLDLTQDG